MTRIPVAGLIGDNLNIAVAMADGHAVRRSTIEHAPGIHEQWPGGNWGGSASHRLPGSTAARSSSGSAWHYLDDERHAWSPTARKYNGDGSDGIGPTLLIAAMRAYVASRISATIELP